MKIPNLVREVLHKTAPIDAADLNELSNKCALWYDENIKEYERKKLHNEELTLKDKGFMYADSWYVRIALAFSFFFIVRFIQNAMNPGDDEPEHDIPQ